MRSPKQTQSVAKPAKAQTEEAQATPPTGGQDAEALLKADHRAVEALFKKYDPAFVLLDEDMATRRIFFVLARRLGKKCYVVSHGIPGASGVSGWFVGVNRADVAAHRRH